MDGDSKKTVIAVAVVIWIIGYTFIGWSPDWPLEILFNFLHDIGIGYGTASGYPWS
ncbi:hypothetical protein [Slackia heliotrinireducens]|uniref:hypothetical protein n=1 Tax=Slackia heliotrinireducens TaxID=84110 RepID=UPI00331520F5